MSELHDQELVAFEAELRKVRPAPVPEALNRRLLAVRPMPRPARVDHVQLARRGYDWVRLLRWLAPAAAMGVLLTLTLGRHYQTSSGRTGTNSQQVKLSSMPISSRVKPAKPEEIEICRTLVATFDAVAELPSGEPVRFRCQQWEDTTMFRDRTHGINVEQSTPRLEIVPVSLDTY